MKYTTIFSLVLCASVAQAETTSDNRLPAVLRQFADAVNEFHTLSVKWEVRYLTSDGAVKRMESIRVLCKDANYREELSTMSSDKKVDSRNVTLLSNGKIYSLSLPQRVMSVKKGEGTDLKTQENPIFLPYMAVINARLRDTEHKPYGYDSRCATLADFGAKGSFRILAQSLEAERDQSCLSQKATRDGIEVRLNTGATINNLRVLNAFEFPSKSSDPLYPSSILRYFLSTDAAGNIAEGLADTFTIREFKKIKYKAASGSKTFTVPWLSDLTFSEVPSGITQKMIFAVESVAINEDIDDQEFDADLSQADSFYDRDSGKFIKQP